jgi:choline dehydrogenase-like flavoprotein
MVFLSDVERQALCAICDALLPPIPMVENKRHLSALQASDNDLSARLEEWFESVASAEEQRDLKMLLRSFELGAFQALLGGSFKAFSSMTQAERENVLASWATSRIATRRKAFQGIKRLALFLGYTLPDTNQLPYYQDISYPGAPGASDAIVKTIQPYAITSNQTLTTEVLIIGSGAGGGVVAGELAAADFEVMVIEKGGYYAEQDFSGNEAEMSAKLFEKRGSLTTADTSIVVLAASLLGGGTTVNWNASFRTPDHVLREWAHEYGIADAVSDTWQQSLDAVTERSNVNCDESHVNGNNRVLARGLEKLGWQMEVIPRNVKGCEECSFCNYGCAFGAKQGTMKTYLQDAYNKGARIVVRANVRRVLYEQGIVRGAVVEAEDANGKTHLLTIRAKIVVVSAGTIHTPAILLRSGLQNPNIGANLHLHPTTLIFSRFDEVVRPWQGVPMSRVSKQFSDLDGRGYGFALEVAPSHPGLTAATIPWINATQHKSVFGSMEQIANVIAITRDYHGGQVKVDRFGEPVLHYRLHPYDARHLQRGIIEALKVHHAAGAVEFFAPHAHVITYKNDGNTSNFVRFLRRVEDAGLAPHSFPLFSAHQMSSARMSGSPQQGATKPNGETWEVKNLFVADGSSMPTATGVNPMMSIMATAHYIAQQIKQLR